MSAAEIAVATSLLALIGSIVVGWFTYQASNKASQRTADAQKQANSTDGFDRLTKAQEAQLKLAYERLAHAEQVAATAGQRAEEAVHKAEEALQAAERSDLRLAQLTIAYTDLNAWANEPCPHDRPPPQPPTWLPL